MKITDIFKRQDRTFSFEFFPPKTYLGAVKFGINAGQLIKLDPSFVTVTYGAGGNTRDNTFDLVKLFHQQLGFVCMAHYTCINATEEKVANDMRTLGDMGIENVMLIRGDPPKGDNGKAFPNPDGFNYGTDLVRFVKNYDKYDFCIGAGAYPEKHIEASSMEEDLENLKKKVDAGADFLVTQMYFDNRYYWEFLDKTVKKGINVRIIPGIIPITNFKQISKFAAMTGANIPDSIRKKMEPHQEDPDAIYKLGLELAIEQSYDLLDNGAPGIHFYTLNKSRAAIDLYEALADEFKIVRNKYKKSFTPHVPVK